MCDYPDAPGPREGRIDKLKEKSRASVARLQLTYVDGLPTGTTRVVELFDNCPHGFTARFEPIEFVRSTYLRDIGMGTSFYDYRPNEGYVRKKTNETGVVDANLRGPTPGYQELSGTYTGSFLFGSTRRRYDGGIRIEGRGKGARGKGDGLKALSFLQLLCIDMI